MQARALCSLLTLLLAGAGLVQGAAAGGGGRSLALAGASFSDTPGDTAGSDITGLTITDDASRGRLTFTLRVTALQPATELSVYLDTDRSEPTPRFWGSEYFMSWAQQPGDNGNWTLQRRNGSDWVRLDPAPTLGFSRTGGELSWTMTRADMGNPSGFNLYATASDWAGTITTAQDIAPDNGFWSYDLATPPPVIVKPVIGVPALNPARAIAGQRLLVTFPVTRSDTGAPLQRATMVCNPSLAGRTLPHTEQFRPGIARLSFLVPKNAKGKLVRVRLTITNGGQTASRSATFQVTGP